MSAFASHRDPPWGGWAVLPISFKQPKGKKPFRVVSSVAWVPLHTARQQQTLSPTSPRAGGTLFKDVEKERDDFCIASACHRKPLQSRGKEMERSWKFGNLFTAGLILASKKNSAHGGVERGAQKAQTRSG